MQCPFCNHGELRVIDSRNATEANAIKRRRECLKCCQRFTTFETVELTLQVLKRDGRYESFQETKLINGLKAASSHTRIGQDQVHAIASNVKTELLGKQNREISTKEIGELVMKYLKKADMIAYIRFACVYRRFKDVGELMEVLLSATPDMEK
ncbi:transcriptional regulator NrdR [Chlamydia pecorum]|uniref:Transcriptional repressor NrdR n=2 Tax=Chlamydia pecorum TaxID=85991 RepID=A0AA34RD51_CHLPE|nr:transcriptional regulator NrdR [Chlamydia pecorum]AEB41510.1 transcriptional regulator, NrdR family [Chlamydia pecorum E58]AGW37716.1 transcriptional regulator, NrdR family [Chlamydia pecorum PV3056/3]AGW38637.1 transcriptional regulator, NrdR family [Chlamydia pecorum W73]AGW39562.1 transcriptional regulator, NrdR family [Chlamydia pecorum P787]ETF37782.1 NrdR family transcriptional regulator [Chlamydia pecorum VR629]